MILQVFTVYDSKVEAYFSPFFCKTRGEAIRSFTDAISDPQHQFAKHLEDYTLFHIGSYDDAKGELKPEIHSSMGKAIEFAVPQITQKPKLVKGSK